MENPNFIMSLILVQTCLYKVNPELKAELIPIYSTPFQIETHIKS